MIEVTIDIAAACERVWATMADVLRWPQWTPTVTAVRPLGEPKGSPGRIAEAAAGRCAHGDNAGSTIVDTE